MTPISSKIHSTFGVKITLKRELKYWSKKYSQIGVDLDLFFTPLLESNLLLENNSAIQYSWCAVITKIFSSILSGPR